MAAYEASKKLSNELAAAIKDCSGLCLLVDGIHGEVTVLREPLSAWDGVVLSIFEDLCTSIGPCIRDLVENFRAVLNKSVNDASRTGCPGSHLHTDAAIDGVTLRFSESTASS